MAQFEKTVSFCLAHYLHGSIFTFLFGFSGLQYNLFLMLKERHHLALVYCLYCNRAAARHQHHGDADCLLFCLVPEINLA